MENGGLWITKLAGDTHVTGVTHDTCVGDPGTIGTIDARKICAGYCLALEPVIWTFSKFMEPVEPQYPCGFAAVLHVHRRCVMCA